MGLKKPSPTARTTPAFSCPGREGLDPLLRRGRGEEGRRDGGKKMGGFRGGDRRDGEGQAGCLLLNFFLLLLL